MDNKKVIFSIQDLTLGIKDSDGNRTKAIHYGSFDICGGDFIIIRGKNGCGKSTLFHQLTLTETDYFFKESGKMIYNADGFPTICIKEYDDNQAAALRRDIVYIKQEDTFIQWHSAYNALFSMAEAAISEKYKKENKATYIQKLSAIHSLIEEYFNDHIQKNFDLKDFREFKRKRVNSFSGGQRKLLNVLSGFIKARVCDSPLIIMDEPLNNLDGKNKACLNKMISQFKNDHTAILVITHCQIFEGINRCIQMTESPNKEVFVEIKDVCVEPHRDCLEQYN